MRFLALIGLAACTVPRGEFAAEKADALCDVQKRCARGAFHAQYASMDSCRVRVARTVEEEVADFSFCHYSPAEGARCASRVRHLACDDWATGSELEACDLVFDCGFDQ